MKATTLAAALLLAPGVLPAAQEEDRLSIDSIGEDFERRWKKAQDEKDWPELLKLYEGAVERNPNRLAQPDPVVRRWLRMPIVLGDRLGAILPESARESREILAEELLKTLRDREARDRLVLKFGYTRAGRRAIELAANQDYDDGRLKDAIRGWSRTLDSRLSPDVVARLAHAHAAAGDLPALSALRAHADRLGLKGEVTIGGQRRDLHDFLAFLQTSSGRRAPEAPAPRAPERPAPERPTTEIPLGTYDLKTDGGAFGRGAGSMRPAFGRINGLERLLVTNGLRVIAIDPAAAEGGSLESAVQWRYPKEGDPTIRYWMPTLYFSPQPQVGVTISGNRAFATMFSRDSRQGMVGRRQDRFEGPAAIRAFDLATGELLWDTDLVTFDSGDQTKKLLEALPFGRLNFCFTGPPVLRGGHLYAAAMTVYPDRSCYIVCLDPSNGALRWCTWVATAPATRERMSIPAFSEEEDTLVVSTGFGVIASIDARTGAIEWLVKYSGQGNRVAINPPVFHRSLVYILAQDCDVPLVYDRWSGREAELPELKGGLLNTCFDHPEVQSARPGECPSCRRRLERPWREVVRLAGRVGDRLIFTGQKNYAVDVATGEVACLGESDMPRPPQAVIADGLLYFSTRGSLQMVETTAWQARGSMTWTGEEAGHLLFTPGYLAFQGDRLELFTSLGALKERFAPKVESTPPRAEPCRQLGRILEQSGHLKESVAYYRRALSVWEKDPDWAQRSEEMKKKLADLADELGEDFPND